MTDSAIKYVGVDGCKAGWIGVGLSDDDGCPKIEVCADFSDMLNHFSDASLILVDTPIGLCEDGKPSFRACDIEARHLLKERRSSVFRVASRRFVKAAMENPDWGFGKVDVVKNRYDVAKEWLNCHVDGEGSFTSQEFYIIPKIDQVDKALPLAKNDPREIREAHPEVCFMALSKEIQPMSHKKSEPLGFEERIEILRHCAHNVDAVYGQARRKEPRKSQLADDDILDALALAITAKLGLESGNRLRHLPKGLSPAQILRLPDIDPPPKDSKELPMQMVYALPNDEGTPC